MDGGASVFEDTRAGADLGREEFESRLFLDVPLGNILYFPFCLEFP